MSVKFPATRPVAPASEIRTPVETQAPSAEVPKAPQLIPADLRQLPKGKQRAAGSQTSGVHVRMAAMLGQVSGFLARADRALTSGLRSLEQSLHLLADAAFGPAPSHALALSGGQGALRTSSTEAITPKGGLVMMASIRDMLKGHGRLQRECPGEYLDAEYEDVVKDAKGGDKNARKAKKLAEQGKRLSGKLKGKK